MSVVAVISWHVANTLLIVMQVWVKLCDLCKQKPVYLLQTNRHNVETMMVLTMVTLCPRLSLATPSWFSATGTEQESFLDTCSIILVT